MSTGEYKVTNRKVLPCQGHTIMICLPSTLEAVFQYIQVIYLHMTINRPKATICINTVHHTRSKPHEYVTCVKYDLKSCYEDINLFSIATKVWYV